MSSWKNLELELIAPIRFKDFLLTGMSTKIYGLYFGPIISDRFKVF